MSIYGGRRCRRIRANDGAQNVERKGMGARSGFGASSARRCRSAAAAAALVLAAAPLVAPASAAQSRSERFEQRYRALDANERSRALAAARDPSEAEIRRRTGRAPEAPLRVEVLAVEPQRLTKDQVPETYRRRAEVTL